MKRNFSLLASARNTVNGMLMRYAPENVRCWMWDHEYAEGRWKHLENMPNDCAIPYINSYARGGTILDVGCGPGAIGGAIDPASYSDYLGFDISPTAIDIANARNKRPSNRYQVGDMLTFEPPGTYDLIFFGDSLYNFSFSGGKKILKRYASYLNQEGVFVIRTWLTARRAWDTLKMIEETTDVVAKEKLDWHNPMLVIVFRPVSIGQKAPRADVLPALARG